MYIENFYEVLLIRFLIPQMCTVSMYFFLAYVFFKKKVPVTGISAKMLGSIWMGYLLQSTSSGACDYGFYCSLGMAILIFYVPRLIWSIELREGIRNEWDKIRNLYFGSIMILPVIPHVFVLYHCNMAYPEFGCTLIEAVAIIPQYVYMENDLPYKKHVVQLVGYMAVNHFVHVLCWVIIAESDSQLQYCYFGGYFSLPLEIMLVARLVGIILCLLIICIYIKNYEPPEQEVIESESTQPEGSGSSNRSTGDEETYL